MHAAAKKAVYVRLSKRVVLRLWSLWLCGVPVDRALYSPAVFRRKRADFVQIEEAPVARWKKTDEK